MILSSSLLALAALAPVAGEPTPQKPVAIRARRAESVVNGTLEHAVIYVEGGKIVAVGEDLPIERGIPILDLPEEWVVMPGLVCVQSRIGMDGSGYSDSRGHLRASDELIPGDEKFERALEAGVTTIGLNPAGTGIPGKAVAVRPKGDTVASMTILEDAYLSVFMSSNSSAKRLLTGGFEKADKFLEKEQKNREKWDEAQEKKKKKSSKDDDDKKEDEEKDESKSSKDDDVYEPLEPDPNVQPFLDLRAGDLRAMLRIGDAGDYLHLLDAIGEEEFSWDLYAPLSASGFSRAGLATNLFFVKEKVAEAGVRWVTHPVLTEHPTTTRIRNLPAEFHEAGVPLVFLPVAALGVDDFKTWMTRIGACVAAGLDRDAALRAVTLEAAEMLGVADRVGSLESGKDANLVVFNGDPFEPGTRVMKVMLDGDFVYEREN